MSKLYLPLKGEYFEQIRDGLKPWEYRLQTPYWAKRLVDREYDGIVFTMGYPAKDDMTRRLERPWRGFELQTIVHPHFGNLPVEVFAIRTQAMAVR